MNDWDALRAKNNELMAKPTFHWTPQRRAILRARARELQTGETLWFGKPSDGGFSDEWKKRQLGIMRRHVGVATDDELIAFAVAQGIIRKESA